MKFIVPGILALTLISTSVFAASWDDLAATDSIYSELIEKVPSLGSETGIIVSKRESESVVNSLKQWTHIIASNKGSHNQPEYVDISEMRPAEVKKLTKNSFNCPDCFQAPPVYQKMSSMPLTVLPKNRELNLIWEATETPSARAAAYIFTTKKLNKPLY